jgi:hypothetical protein
MTVFIKEHIQFKVLEDFSLKEDITELITLECPEFLLMATYCVMEV